MSTEQDKFKVWFSFEHDWNVYDVIEVIKRKWDTFFKCQINKTYHTDLFSLEKLTRMTNRNWTDKHLIWEDVKIEQKYFSIASLKEDWTRDLKVEMSVLEWNWEFWDKLLLTVNWEDWDSVYLNNLDISLIRNFLNKIDTWI